MILYGHELSDKLYFQIQKLYISRKDIKENYIKKSFGIRVINLTKYFLTEKLTFVIINNKCHNVSKYRRDVNAYFH